MTCIIVAQAEEAKQSLSSNRIIIILIFYIFNSSSILNQHSMTIKYNQLQSITTHLTLDMLSLSLYILPILNHSNHFTAKQCLKPLVLLVLYSFTRSMLNHAKRYHGESHLSHISSPFAFGPILLLLTVTQSVHQSFYPLDLFDSTICLLPSELTP